MLQPGLSCGVCARAVAGRDNYCARYDVLGYQSDGGYAELVAVPAANADRAAGRHRLSSEAAAFPLAFLTAWHMLHGRARTDGGRHRARARRRQRRGTGGDPDRATRRARA